MKKELTIEEVKWTNVSEPTNSELAELARETKLESTDAEFILQDRRRPEVTVRERYILILIQVPVFDKKLRVTSGAALYFVIRNEHLWTVHYEPIVVLKKIIKDIEEHSHNEDDHAHDSALGFTLHIIDQLNAYSFSKIDRLAKHIDIAEDAVFHGNERKMVEEIAILTRDVLDFRKIIGPQESIFAPMPDQPFNDEIKTQWQRVSSQTKQLWEILENLNDSVTELQNTNNSLLQHKENELLRLLTFYSIIAIPLWVFVSPFNPLSPNVSHRIIFFSILGILVIWLLIIFLVFKRKRVL